MNHFQNAIALDPNYEDAKLYLATAYSYQVVPNLDTPENLAIAQKALDGFQRCAGEEPERSDCVEADCVDRSQHQEVR